MYKAIIQYVVFSQTLKGAEYGDIAEQLKEHASQELAHALEVARQIDYLGGDPTVNVKGAEYSQDSTVPTIPTNVPQRLVVITLSKRSKSSLSIGE